MNFPNNIFNNSIAETDKPIRTSEIRNKHEWFKDEIEEIASLKDNWDGEGAYAVFPEVIENVNNFRNILSGDLIEKVDDISPNIRGTITIKWLNRNNDKLSLEIGKTKFAYYVDFTHTNPKFVNAQQIENNYEEVISDLRHLFVEKIPKVLSQERAHSSPRIELSYSEE